MHVIRAACYFAGAIFDRTFGFSTRKTSQSETKANHRKHNKNIHDKNQEVHKI